MEGHSDQIFALAISRDDKWFVSAGHRARGGHAEDGGTDGLGGGGGVHIAGGTMCLTNTQVRHNHAGTSQDNVLGDYLTIC